MTRPGAPPKAPSVQPLRSLGRVGATVWEVARRPWLWPAAAAFVPRHWWRRWPPLPFPDRSYLRFRVETMYGSQARVEPGDVVRYLEWCRRMRLRGR